MLILALISLVSRGFCFESWQPAYDYYHFDLGDLGHHRAYEKPQVPRDMMVDVINDLGIKLLAIHNEHNDNNVAISPYGALSVVAALSEGLAGDAAHEILQAAHIPKDRHIIRIGLRDIHRHLKSYFIPQEGFLAGLTLNLNNVTLRSEYEDVLRFYGFDYGSFNNALYPASPTTQKPNATIGTTLGIAQTTTGTTEKTETTTETFTAVRVGGPVTTDKVPVETTTVTEGIATTSLGTTMQGREETNTEMVPQTTETFVPTTNAVQQTTITSVPTTNTVQQTTETSVPTTNIVLQTAETYVPTTTVASTQPTTNKLEETTKQADAGITTKVVENTVKELIATGETSSKTTSVLITETTKPKHETTTIEGTITEKQPTTTSLLEPTTVTKKITQTETPTSKTEETTTLKATTITINTPTTITPAPIAPTTTNVPLISAALTEITLPSLTTTIVPQTNGETPRTTREVSIETRVPQSLTTLPETATVLNNITRILPGDTTEPTTQPITTVPDEISTVFTKITPVLIETTTEPMSQTLTTVPDEVTTKISTRPNEITLEPISQPLTTAPDKTATVPDEITTVPIRVSSESNEFTTMPSLETTTMPFGNTKVPIEGIDDENTFERPEETTVQAFFENIDTTTQMFFESTPGSDETTTFNPNAFDFENYNYDTNGPLDNNGSVPPAYDDSMTNFVGTNNLMPNNPEGASFNRNFKRKARSVVDYVIARYYDDRHHYSGAYIPRQRPQYVPQEPLTFLVYGKYREPGVNFMKYDTVLPFFFVQNLNALALSFPLDSSKYYLLLVLPVDDGGVDQLICDLRLHGNLRYIVENLRLTHVVATIPSFMLKGYVSLTPSLQRLGIRKIFEPRQADFSPMTNQSDIYVTNIEQAVTVTIRNYLDPSAQNYKNFHQYSPVHFKADHPFLYFVIDSELHVALMVGKVVNPLNSRIR